MNSHNQTDNLIDLSLRHSLKNWADHEWAAHEWATHKNSSSDGREKLLAAAGQEISLPRRKLPKINFGWLFGFYEPVHEFPVRPINNYEFEYMDFLKTRLAFL